MHEDIGVDANTGTKASPRCQLVYQQSFLWITSKFFKVDDPQPKDVADSHKRQGKQADEEFDIPRVVDVVVHVEERLSETVEKKRLSPQP